MVQWNGRVGQWNGKIIARIFLGGGGGYYLSKNASLGNKREAYD